MKWKDLLYKITHWENWNYQLKYIPIGPVWIWYCIRSRNPWFFTASNPTLTFGGFEGEGKKEFIANCGICHSLRYISMQPAFPRKTWDAEIHKMIVKYKAPVDSLVAVKIADYLTKIKGA